LISNQFYNRGKITVFISCLTLRTNLAPVKTSSLNSLEKEVILEKIILNLPAGFYVVDGQKQNLNL